MEIKLYISTNSGSNFLKYPHANPTKVPTITTITELIKAKNSDFLAPINTKENISLPITSVPNQYSDDGAKFL